MTVAGAMREVIHLQSQTTVQDETGQRRLVWADVVTRRAALAQTPGSESLTSAGRSARVPTTFRIRYPRTLEVTPAMRIVHRGKVFNVVSATDLDGRRVDLHITAEELVGEAP